MVVQSLSPAAVARANASGAPLDTASTAQLQKVADSGPYWINCQHLDGRFQLAANYTLEYNSVVLVNCRTLSTAGFITKHTGSKLVLNNTIENQGSVCVPLPTAMGLANSLPRQPGLPVPAGRPRGQQVTALAPASSNWCTAAAAGRPSSGTTALPPELLPTILANRSTSETCQQPAFLLGSTAWLETPTSINASRKDQQQTPQEPFTMLAVQSAILCPEPVSNECLRQNGTGGWVGAAFHDEDPIGVLQSCVLLLLLLLLAALQGPLGLCGIVCMP
jgi:hypothetical protein